MIPWRRRWRWPWRMGRWWRSRDGGHTRRSTSAGSSKEADACTTPGAVGALLRREGLYSSHLVAWRRARRRGELAALTPKKRGRKPTPVDPRDRKIAELERQLVEMTGRAKRATASHPARRSPNPTPAIITRVGWQTAGQVSAGRSRQHRLSR
jgi:hypothetical protein